MEWPPRVMSTKAVSHSIRELRKTNKKRLGKGVGSVSRVVIGSVRVSRGKRPGSKRRTKR